MEAFDATGESDGSGDGGSLRTVAAATRDGDQDGEARGQRGDASVEG